MPFNIGDVVRKKSVFTKAPAEKGTIVDKMYSEADSKFIYKVCFANDNVTFKGFYSEESLELWEEIVKANVYYIVETEILENVAVVKILKREENSTVREEIVRGHGHIIHEGDVGIVQALSYALKKAYEKINGGKI